MNYLSNKADSDAFGFERRFRGGAYLKRAVSRGFSLTELLVSIAIVAVLAAILIPVIRSTRESAHASQCASNLRQIGVYFGLYTTEYDGKLPPCMWDRDGDGPNKDFNPWPRYLARLMPEFSGGHENWWWKSDLFVCPTVDNKRSYAMNWWAGGISISELLEPSKKVLAADSVVGNEDWALALYPVWGGKSDIDFRHNGHANILFFDGHVESRDNDEKYEWNKKDTWIVSEADKKD